MSDKQEIKPGDVGKASEVLSGANESKPLEFSFRKRKTKPSRRYRKGSKYDPVLDSFLEGKDDLVELRIAGKEANYIRTQIGKRIETREIKNVIISVVNDVCYLERASSSK